LNEFFSKDSNNLLIFLFILIDLVCSFRLFSLIIIIITVIIIIIITVIISIVSELLAISLSTR